MAKIMGEILRVVLHQALGVGHRERSNGRGVAYPPRGGEEAEGPTISRQSSRGRHRRRALIQIESVAIRELRGIRDMEVKARPEELHRFRARMDRARVAWSMPLSSR